MKFIKFDIFYPPEYLKQKQAENSKFIAEMNFETYYTWLMNLKMGYYDMFQKYFNSKGWEAYEFYYQDDIFVEKLAIRYHLKPGIIDFFKPKYFAYWSDLPLKFLKQALRVSIERKELRKRFILRKYIHIIQPDIIFLREPCQIDNLFWQPYKKNTFIATMIGCNISHPINWLLHTSDVVFTNTPEFNVFFNQNLVESYLIEYGYDTELTKELSEGPKKYDVSFVGLLGTKDQEKKTQLMELIATNFNFYWWGPKGGELENYPNLIKSWQGFVAGKEMYQVYADSKIVVNEYVHSNGDNAVNLRLKEAMGIGAFLLTREAENIKQIAKAGAVVFFNNQQDCIDKIQYYLIHEEERNRIGKNAQNYIVKHHSNRTLLDFIIEKINTGMNKKFPSII